MFSFKPCTLLVMYLNVRVVNRGFQWERCGGGGAPPGEIGLIGPMSCCSSNICHSVGEWACTGAGLGIVFCLSRFNSVFLLSGK